MARLTGLPVFETARLRLTPRSIAETEACLAMDRAPGVTLHVAGPWDDPDAHRLFVERRTSGPYPAGLGYWTIRLRGQPQGFLGWVLLIPEDARGPETEIGWRLRPEYWGQGIATEAAQPILAHAFRTLRCPRLVADIMDANAGSLRVAAKLGFAPADGGSALYRRLSLAREDYVARLA
ncbi:GNAT family N-acetyltransferase [Acidisoma cellulosilytica]|uniref:GNAT family N-acetyltransferase n=1 Tax=Acidisoma cellulosilyticum TaxID=2802395 RepID=A0A964E696_9PROT|nr:GNAT family N-acetyltransferase [Acidisoma cellulosilyticum]MCB8883277.1 GNAT family N-acetyltransferase [Acidisoma cellulosilyticum]